MIFSPSLKKWAYVTPPLPLGSSCLDLSNCCPCCTCSAVGSTLGPTSDARPPQFMALHVWSLYMFNFLELTLHITIN